MLPSVPEHREQLSVPTLRTERMIAACLRLDTRVSHLR
jgi:hypothetical protein